MVFKRVSHIKVMLTWMLPGLAGSLWEAEEPGLSCDKWTTGTAPVVGQSGVKRTTEPTIWRLEDNIELMECYYNSRPNQRIIWNVWRLYRWKKPTSTLTEKQLVTQCFNIENCSLNALHIRPRMFRKKRKDVYAAS